VPPLGQECSPSVHYGIVPEPAGAGNRVGERAV
jgi:hypothetical protein